jgi:hypothetical protein
MRTVARGDRDASSAFGTSGMIGRFKMELRSEPWGKGDYTFRICPVCAEKWRPWPNSLLPCHAKCLLTEAAQDELLDEDATATEQVRRLGLTIGTIRASLAAARRRRREDDRDGTIPRTR